MGRDDGNDRRDADRAAILARRSRFIAIALGGLTSATTLGCGEDEAPPPPQLELIELRPQPQVCLSLEDPETIDERVRRMEAEREGDAGPSQPASATPVPCLSAVAPEAEVDAGPAEDPKPPRMSRRRRVPTAHPCLQPMPCLDFPADFDGKGE